MKLEIDIKGSTEFVNKLNKFKSQLMDFKDDFNNIGDYLVKYYGNYPFFTAGAIFGKKWEPLKASTKTEKSKKYPGTPMLIRTGLMASSFNFTSSSQSLLVGNSAPYFKYHQSAEPRAKLPRRAMIAINQQIKDYVTNQIKEGIVKRYNAL